MVCIFYLLFEGWSHQLPRKLLVLIVIVSIQFTPWRDNCWKSSFDNLCYVLTIIDLNFFHSFVSRIWLNFDLLFLRAEHHFLLYPRVSPTMKLSFSRTLHQLCVFPAVDISTFFSHALFPLHIFPLLVPVTCFARFSLVHPVAVVEAEFIGWSSGLHAFSWQQPSWSADIRSFSYLFQLDALHPAESTLTSSLAAGKQPLEALQEAVEVNICFYLSPERELPLDSYVELFSMKRGY